METVEVKHLGLTSYREVWSLQRSLQQSLIQNSGSQTLILCQHHPVITLGRNTKPESILASREHFLAQGIELIEIERGGDATYHGPGQIVGYPILDLSTFRRDVGWYMRSLEEVIIRTLQEFDIIGLRVSGRTGVWTEHTGNDNFFSYRKVASLGVRISRWCTLHGFSLNVLNCSSGFSLIHPCGYSDTRVTSIEEELLHRGMPLTEDILSKVESALERNFLTVFNVKHSNSLRMAS